MPNNISARNDHLTKEFYEIFWEDLKTPSISSFKLGSSKDKLNNFQEQAVIRVITKMIKKQDLFKIGDQYLY